MPEPKFEGQNQEEKTEELNWKEKLKQELLREGLEAEDIDISINLAERIHKLDTLVFGESVPVIFADHECDQNKDIKALYAPPTVHQDESYVVYIPKMKESLDKVRFYFDNKGKLTNKETNQPITPQELLIEIASHEIRHRFQQRQNLDKKMGKKSARERDSHSIEFDVAEAFHAGKTLEEIAELIKH